MAPQRGAPAAPPSIGIFRSPVRAGHQHHLTFASSSNRLPRRNCTAAALRYRKSLPRRGPGLPRISEVAPNRTLRKSTNEAIGLPRNSSIDRAPCPLLPLGQRFRSGREAAYPIAPRRRKRRSTVSSCHDRDPAGNPRDRRRDGCQRPTIRSRMRRTLRSISSTKNGSARTRGCLAVIQRDLAAGKYWCPVNRIDNVYGHRHLICNCMPDGRLQRRGGRVSFANFRMNCLAWAGA